MNVSELVSQSNNNNTTADLKQVWEMINTDLEKSRATSNAIYESTYMTVKYEGRRPDSEALVWTVKLIHGAHFEYRLLQGVSAPICVIRDVNYLTRSRAVEFSGPDHDEVMRRMDQAVTFVTGMK